MSLSYGKLIFLFLALLSLHAVSTAWAEEDAHELFERRLKARTTPVIEEQKERPNKPKKIKSFSALQRKTLKLMCTYMEQDNRREALFVFADAHKRTPGLCAVCNQFYKDIAGACRFRKSMVKDKEDDATEELQTEQVVFLAAREPRAEVLDLGSEVFRELFLVEEYRDEYTLAVIDLENRFLNQSELSVGAKEYFRNFFSYILTTFHAYIEYVERKKAKEDALKAAEEPTGFRDFGSEVPEESKQQKLESLFDF